MLTRLPRLDPDELGNAHLHELINNLHPDDALQFLAKFTKLPLRARFHTYRELLLGTQLRQNGADWRYEQPILGKTPDWSLRGEDSQVIEVVDVMTLHQRCEKEKEISDSLRSTGSWCGWIGIPPDHIFRKLNDKANKYSKLARELKVPYVIAVFGEFVASISPEDIEQVLCRHSNRWFYDNPEVAGILYFRGGKKSFTFEFRYFPNPGADHPSMFVASALQS